MTSETSVNPQRKLNLNPIRNSFDISLTEGAEIETIVEVHIQPNWTLIEDGEPFRYSDTRLTVQPVSDDRTKQV